MHQNGKQWKLYTYKDNLVIGDFLTWFDNGKSEFHHILCELGQNGIQQEWYSNGRRSITCHYVNDKKHGKSEEWWNNGKP